MPKNFYVTSPIFYPNANLHMGHAYTMTLCDVFSRYHKLIGENSYFLTGADENTGKVIKAALENKQSIEVFLASVTAGFKKLYVDLDISYDQFIQTTDKKKHWPGAITMWNKLVDSGDIYKSSYNGLYCASCEAFYTEKDLINDKCPIHGIVLEKIKEENYFFRLSKYTEEIKSKIKSNEMLIAPETRRNEILALLDQGLQDISFSRPIKNVPHGIPVPGDSSQVIYVWCDALVNYISALGYGSGDDSLFLELWPANVQVLGKDILRFHAAIWPAMLLSAGLPLPKALLVHGFITSDGKKMSKTLGNVIDPQILIKEYGKDALRYYLTREVSPFEDGDITLDKFKEAYNANLANGLGNLVSRVMTMAEMNLAEPVKISGKTIPQEFFDLLEKFEIQKAADLIWQKIAEADKLIQEIAPFKLVKTDKEKGIKIIKDLVIKLYTIGRMLNPILPEASKKIKDLVKINKAPETPLFLRKD